MISPRLIGLALGESDLFEADNRATLTMQSSESTIVVAGNMSLNGRPICGDAEMPSRAASNTGWQY
jgi:hypothetical protein